MIRLLTLFFTLLAVVFSQAAQASETIAPHRAIYSITFAEAKPESNLVAANGKWIVKVQGAACTGYDISYRFVTRLGYGGGRSDLLDSRGKSFEGGEGNAFDFSTATYRNNTIVEDIKGIASRKDGAVGVKLARPEKTDLSLDGPILFPTQHFVKIIKSAIAGENFLNSRVYEGVEGAKEPFDVTAVIGAERTLQDDGETPYKILAQQKVRHWPVSLSYFKQNATGDATPEWQNRFLLYENGVSREFVFDYGDFSLKGTLEELEMLPVEDCS